MKSNKTMLSLARALAYSKDIQKFAVGESISIIGFALTMKDLLKLYKEEGFTSHDVPHRHVKLWKELGLVKTFYNDQIVVFVPLVSDYDEIYALTMAQKELGSSAIAILPSEVTA